MSNIIDVAEKIVENPQHMQLLLSFQDLVKKSGLDNADAFQVGCVIRKISKNLNPDEQKLLFGMFVDFQKIAMIEFNNQNEDLV